MSQRLFGQTIVDNVAQITFRVELSALHELKNSNLSDEENKKIFGKCFRTHGHNYFLEVTIEGPINPVLGLCCDRDHVQNILNDEVITKFSGKNLNSFLKARLERIWPANSMTFSNQS